MKLQTKISKIILIIMLRSAVGALSRIAKTGVQSRWLTRQPIINFSKINDPNTEREALQQFLKNNKTPTQQPESPLSSKLHTLDQPQLLQSLTHQLQKSTLLGLPPPLPILQQTAHSLHYLQTPSNIHQILQLLYPYLDQLPDTTLTFVFQNILAYRPEELKLKLKLPKAPLPRSLNDLELCFLCMAEVLPGDMMVPWVEQVPLWEGRLEGLAVLGMGVWTVYEKLGERERGKYRRVFEKANQAILLYLKQQGNYELTITILVIALEMNNPIALKLLEEPILVEQLQIQQLCMLLINLNKFKHHTKHESAKFNQINNELANYILSMDWPDFMKVAIFVDFYKILQYQNDIKGIWAQFRDKLISFSLKNYQTFKLTDLSPTDVISIICSIQSKRINRKQLLYAYLIMLEDKLDTLSKDDLFLLTKAMVTYVRQFESFFIQLRKLCENRKWEFSADQIKELTQVFNRCRVLFNRPFYIQKIVSCFGKYYIPDAKSLLKRQIIGKIDQVTKRWTVTLSVKYGQIEKQIDFIIDTGSKSTFLTEQNMQKLCASESQQLFKINGLHSEIYTSTDYYKDVNLLGSQFINQYLSEMTVIPKQQKVILKF